MSLIISIETLKIPLIPKIPKSSPKLKLSVIGVHPSPKCPV